MADVRETAARYINTKPRTRYQVEQYLRKKGFEEEKIADAVRELEEYRYIDDFNFAAMYFEYGFEKGRGILRIKRELAEKGVASDVIEQAFEELEDVPDQYLRAKDIADGMLEYIDTEDLDYEERRKLQARVGRRLVSRGFPSDIVYKVINKI